MLVLASSFLLLTACGGGAPASSESKTSKEESTSHPTGLSSSEEQTTSHETGLSSSKEETTSHETGLSSSEEATTSHETGLSSSEEGPNPRDVDTWTTEQAFREMYLKPFEIAVKEGQGTAIMSGFNNIAATWCGSCYAQNVQILRNEWGFRGTMVTDWSNGDDNMYPERGIRAGNDIWLNPNAANARPLNMSNPTTVYCAKIAARNVIWTYCDTYNTYINYDSSNDAVKVEIGTATVKKGASVIVPMTVGINVGIGVIALVLLGVAWIPFKRKKPE